MSVAQRTDLCFEDKIKLSHHIRQRCVNEGFPVPALELILGMPGSTIEDFYSEMEIIWNFQAWTSFRHDYMLMPDTSLSSESYLTKFSIKPVKVYTDLVDEQGIDNQQSLFSKKKNFFYTISECYSYSFEEMCEMFFMNLAGNFLLKNLYPNFPDHIRPGDFGKSCFEICSRLEGFDPIYNEIIDILSPHTPARSIKRLGGIFRTDVVEGFLLSNLLIIKNELYRRLYVETRTTTESKGNTLHRT
jgi:hypothetical protein